MKLEKMEDETTVAEEPKWEQKEEECDGCRVKMWEGLNY